MLVQNSFIKANKNANKKQSLIEAFFAILMITLIMSFSSDVLAKSNLAGESIYQQCAACHGNNAQGNDALNAPALAGQFDWYLIRQIKHFNQSLRGEHMQDAAGQQMAAIAKTINVDKDLSTLSKYIESLAVSTKKNLTNKDISVEGDSYDSHKNGSRYYQAKCGACHGGQAQGNKSFNAPKLNGLSSSYLLRQMKHFSTGIRGTHKEDKFGRQMAMMAKTTSGSELDDIIFYITHQSNSADK
jgi:cytochrome c oxidase subunit 2